MKKKSVQSLLILLVWVAVSVSLFKLMPDVGDLLLVKGQPHIPDSYSLKIAGKLNKEFNNYSADSKVMSFVVVFNDSRELSAEQMDSIHTAVEHLKNADAALGVKMVTNHFDTPDLASQVVSKDKSTVLVSVSLDKLGRSLEEISAAVNNELTDATVTHYLTGTDFILDANVKTDMDAVHKTEIFTGLIIFAILLLVFRSPITPLVSLITILLTYLTSLGVVTQLVDKFNFPFSVATQSFLILVLFGIGTDYGLLLLTRFKAELANNSVDISIKNTYKSAGKTVLFSSLTVLIGFGVLWFAKFSIFKAGAAVAIGVGFLIISLFTLLKCFMVLLGKKMFWPVNKKLEHKDSKVWGGLTKAATGHPFIAAVLILALASPILFFQNSPLSYNMLKDISPDFESMKAITIIADKYGEGIISPATIYLKSDVAMNNNDSLGSLDKIVDNLRNVEGVADVFSVTQPKGAKIEQLYLKDQISTVVSGLGDAKVGIGQLIDGLSGANKKIKNSFNFSDIGSLININEMIGVKTGIKSLDDQLAILTDQVSAAIMDLVQKNMQGSLDDIDASVKQLENGLSQAVDGLNQISAGIDKANAYLASLPNSSNGQLFYIPADQIMQGEFRQSVDTFLSGDQKIVKIIVLLSIDPYSAQAMTTVDNIEANLQDSLKGSSLTGATFGIDGISSMNRDLQTISMGDLNRSIMIMLIGIGIVLLFLSKSFFKALSIIGALLIANYSAITVTALLFKNILHVGDLSWTVPFFTSIMIFALGVDYSIFFLMRLDENRKLDTRSALIKASAGVGGVVISAAIILSGTFAALYPAKVPMLIELATAVIIGLFLLAFVLLPIFLPAAFMIIDKIETLADKWKSKGMTEIEGDGEEMTDIIAPETE